MSTPEDLALTALRAATDQHAAGLRDLADVTPGLAELSGAMARMILEQCPDTDGRAVIAAAQAANGAIALTERGGGALDAIGVVNLLMLAGRSIAEDGAPS